MVPRDDKYFCRGNMSDSLFSAGMLNTVRPKVKGLLQFSQSTVDRISKQKTQEHDQ
jgi:hypothetical protein